MQSSTGACGSHGQKNPASWRDSMWFAWGGTSGTSANHTSRTSKGSAPFAASFRFTQSAHCGISAHLLNSETISNAVHRTERSLPLQTSEYFSTAGTPAKPIATDADIPVFPQSKCSPHNFKVAILGCIHHWCPTSNAWKHSVTC